MNSVEKLLKDKIKNTIALYEKLSDEGSLLYLSLNNSIELIKETLNNHKKILIFGNGGSATQATHFSAELVNRFYLDRKALPAISLTCDISSITSIANDSDYNLIFSRQLEALGIDGDLAIGLTTSGQSLNVLKALKKAKELNLKTIGLCGQNRSELEKIMVDQIIFIPSHDTPQVQEIHLFILHLIAEIIEKDLFLPITR